MTSDRSPEYLASLVKELCKLSRETEWVEFKENDETPREIGEYISALANAAAFAGKAHAYIVWGVRNESHEIVGTRFRPGAAKSGNEELENWLLRLLSPRLHFRFFEVEIDGVAVVILEIERAFRHPVRFEGNEYIRIGSYKKRLKEYPDHERKLWQVFDRTPFETCIAAEHKTEDEILRLIDYPPYFDLLERPLPESREGILKALADDSLIQPCRAGGWNITNLGALLFAKKLSDFPHLARKAMRVIQYRGNDRIETIKEQMGVKGYAGGFEGLIEFINSRLPTNEIIEQALRKTLPMYPELAVRELVANALVHQDLFATGTGPMVELFDNRIEITNPGIPLVDIERFLDSPPKSRNEALASFMRRIGICEERGSGVDKVVFQTEFFQLPAPLFETIGDNTRAILFAHRPLVEMDKADRMRAVYLHACLRYVKRDFMTNTSIRERFGISEQSSAQASRLIKEAVEGGFIRAFDPKAGRRFMKYVPFWAR